MQLRGLPLVRQFVIRTIQRTAPAQMSLILLTPIFAVAYNPPFTVYDVLCKNPWFLPTPLLSFPATFSHKTGGLCPSFA